MGKFIDEDAINARLAPLHEKYGPDPFGPEVWAEKMKIEREYGMMLFKRKLAAKRQGYLVFKLNRPVEAGEGFTVTAKTKLLFRGRLKLEGDLEVLLDTIEPGQEKSLSFFTYKDVEVFEFKLHGDCVPVRDPEVDPGPGPFDATDYETDAEHSGRPK